MYSPKKHLRQPAQPKQQAKTHQTTKQNQPHKPKEEVVPKESTLNNLNKRKLSHTQQTTPL